MKKTIPKKFLIISIVIMVILLSSAATVLAVVLSTPNNFIVVKNVDNDFLSYERIKSIDDIQKPSKEGYNFDDWYTDVNLTQKLTDIPRKGDFVIYAKWIPNKYTITFNSNGGSEVPAITQDYESTVTAPTAPALSGYAFAGWFTDEALQNEYIFTKMPLDGITLYAKWTINKYTINFVSNGGSDVENIVKDYASTVSAPTNPTREGYTFAGWFTDNNTFLLPYTFTTIPLNGITLYAKWTANEYTINFESNGGSDVADITQGYGTEVFAPGNPTKSGYTFAGWFTDDVSFLIPYTFNTMPLNGITLYANWEICDFTIAFNSNGGSIVEAISQDFGTPVSAPTNPTKDGYTFAGWFTDNNTFLNQYEFTTMPLNGITLYAKWTANEYTISFDSNGGSAVANITQDYGTAVSAPTNPIKDGYTFAGWFTDDQSFLIAYTFTTMPLNGITLYADWTANEYTISFDSNGGSVVADITQDYKTAVSAPNSPTKDGYTFAGWFTDNNTFLNQYEFTTMPLNGITLYADWTVNQYTITFESNGGSAVADITQDYGTAVIAPSDPTRLGHTFLGWYEDNYSFLIAYTFTTMPLDGITLFAKWSVNNSTIGFESNGGSIVEAIVQDFGTPVSAPEEPTREGYTFAGWFTDNNTFLNQYEFTTMPLIGVTLYADWTANEYTISFESNGGSSVSDITQDYGTAVLAPSNPTRTGYTFAGWFIDDVTFLIAYTFTTMPIDGITLYAKWLIADYTVTFNKQGGAGGTDSITTTYFSDMPSINAPEKNGYVFKGYYSEENGQGLMYVSENMTSTANWLISKDITLYAFWQLHNEGLMFTLIDNSAYSVSRGSASEYDIFIPAEYNQLPVTEIALNGFENYSAMTSISIPNSITKIGANAFINCTGLTEISIPESVMDIGLNVLGGCTNLETLTTPFKSGYFLNSHSYLRHFFGGNGYNSGGNAPESLKTVNVLGIKSLGRGAFFGNTNITLVTLPDGLETIGWSAFEGCSGLTSIIIPNSVKSINTSAFENCTGLTSIQFPAGLNTISENILKGCTSLETLTTPFADKYLRYFFGGTSYYEGGEIPASLSTISVLNTTALVDNAFYGVNNLTTINLPEGLTSIGNQAFYGCSGITSIIIPESVTSIGSEAFRNCSGITSLSIPEIVTFIGSNALTGCTSIQTLSTPLDGEYDANTHSYLRYFFGGTSYSSGGQVPITLTTVVITNATAIADYAFANLNEIRNITVPQGITSIGREAFLNLDKITSVSLPESIEYLGNRAFENCSSLSNITLPNNLSSLGLATFKGCTQLTSMVIPNGVTVIQDETFNNCENLASITLPNNLISIGFNAFARCKSLLSVEIPSTVNSIGRYAFANCENLTAINIPNGITTISTAMFLNCYKLSDLTIPSSVTTIESMALNNCSSLTDLLLPASVTKMEAGSVQGCTNLQTITLPYAQIAATLGQYNQFTFLFNTNVPASLHTVTINGIGILPSSSFMSLTNLKTIVIMEGITAIGNGSFNSCSNLETISLPSTLTSIGRDAFVACSSLISVEIPESVTTIGRAIFIDCASLQSITIPMLGEYNADNHSYLRYFFGGTSYNTGGTVPSSLKTVNIIGTNSIGDYAFYGLNNLTSIILPYEVTSIGNESFRNCSSLQSLILPETFIEIGSNILTGCTSLHTLTLSFMPTPQEHNTPNYLSYYFGSTSYTNGSTVPESLKTVNVRGSRLPSYSFYENIHITTVNLGADITVIDGMAFSGCSSLSSVLLSEDITVIQNFAFTDCVSLTSITIPNKVTTIGQSAFRRTGLTSIVLPSSLKTIQQNVFRECTDLIEATLPVGLTSIAHNIFYGCSNLKTLTAPFESAYSPSNNSYLRYYFGGTAYNDGEEVPSSLTTVNVLKTTIISDYAFYGINSLTAVNIPNNVTQIRQYAFYGCSNLSQIELPFGITIIGNNAFSDCSSLTSLILPSSVQTLGNDAFSGCLNLTAIIIPSSVTSIGSNVLTGCNNLETLTTPFAEEYNYNTHSYLRYFFGGTSYNSGSEIPESLKSLNIVFANGIGDYALYNCSNLTSISIPASVTNIGEAAFYGCSGITNLNIQNGVISIGDNAFRNSGLTQIEIPGTVTTIGTNVLTGTSIQTLTAPFAQEYNTNNHSYLRYFFGGTSYNTGGSVPLTLTTVNVLNTTSLGDYAFFNSGVLNTVTLPNNLISIGNSAFMGCGNIVNIIIPDTVNSIGNDAFRSCSSLTSIVIPESVTSIGTNILTGCSGLQTLTTPLAGEYTINNHSYIRYFFGGTSYSSGGTIPSLLRTVNVIGTATIGEYAFNGVSQLTTITLPNNLETIGANAFRGCTGLTTITIPTAVNSIGENAFSNCTNLSEIIINATTPPTLGLGVFNLTHDELVIKVPTNLVNTYKNAAGWSEYEDRIIGI